MSRKLVLAPQDIVLAQSMAADFSILPTEVSFQDNISYQIVVDANGSEGQFYLQGSLDTPSAPKLAANDFSSCVFTDIMPCGLIIAVDDSILINVNQWPYKYIRVRYDSSVAGTGVCDIKLMARTVGA